MVKNVGALSRSHELPATMLMRQAREESVF